MEKPTDTTNTATAQALTTPPGSRLDFSILPRHLKGVCKCNGFPLSMEQEALITGAMAAVQSQIEEEGLENTIYAFSPANDNFTS